MRSFPRGGRIWSGPRGTGRGNLGLGWWRWRGCRRAGRGLRIVARRARCLGRSGRGGRPFRLFGRDLGAWWWCYRVGDGDERGMVGLMGAAAVAVGTGPVEEG